jgi:hypothetical protein
MQELARYGGIGFQMMAIIAGGTALGYWADTGFSIGFPIFTLIGAMVSVGLAIYSAIKDFLK